MKVKHLLYIALLLMISMLVSCTSPFRIIDKNTYMVILERPEQKVIIKTPDGSESAVGYIDMEE